MKKFVEQPNKKKKVSKSHVCGRMSEWAKGMIGKKYLGKEFVDRSRQA